MTVYNVTKTFDKGFVNAIKAYLNVGKIDIRYSDIHNDVNIFIYDTTYPASVKNKKELCLKRVKQYINEFKNDNEFTKCPTIISKDFHEKRKERLQLKALDTITKTLY